MLSFLVKTKNNFGKVNKKGFTLIELMITIVIFVILTGITLFSQNGFDNTILLKNLAYDIALTIRQAQTYGVNVKESQVSGAFSSYGVYFNKATNDKSFILFADTDKNNNFNGDSGCPTTDPECIQKYSLKRNSYISGLCVGADDSHCSPVDNLTIYFMRPDPDAIIFTDIYNSSTLKSYYAKITVSSATNSATSSIVVTNPGQIYIKND